MNLRIEDIKPSFGYVFAKPLEIEPKTDTKFIDPTEVIPHNLAEVIAIGIGNPVSDGKYIPMQVRPTSIIIYEEGAAKDFKYEKKDYLFIDQRSILGTFEA